MKLRELINRLEQLSHKGENDNLEVFLKPEEEWQIYPQIESVRIIEESDYNFDEANCGPDKWVVLETAEDMYKIK